jgi:hypothetical protein
MVNLWNQGPYKTLARAYKAVRTAKIAEIAEFLDSTEFRIQQLN